ncbi:ABC-2 family transporter protein [Gemmata obscuriglobus]|uniref:ABC transporter permease n=1 Tax=Gemmata obscuriglobus TaxID=114 RepID=A0A2Z3H4E6_9BACT|nr:ABC transporter permease [Gemmata obscuriglobus]AWM40638.1 ABC transporter permease [Gemmata obscuriglobus]QEG26100.1 ABC-2 family transporter protein [Gemmata obscuriglobus]VTS00583.1 : ABC2_membrane_3 [Gemmata obscuriglobus UQM 2246]
MRWYILKALIRKEVARHLANRGGIALAVLLVAAAVLLSVFAPSGQTAEGTGMVDGVHHCFVEFDEHTPFVKHLRANVPEELKGAVRFRELRKPDQIDEAVRYDTGTGAIQIRQPDGPGRRTAVKLSIWHPDGEPLALAPYEQWVWKESRRFFAREAALKLPGAKLPDEPAFDSNNQWLVLEAHKRLQEQVEAARKAGNVEVQQPLVPDLSIERRGLGGKVLDFRAAIATGMVVFALYFACVYLLPTLNCEERERGVLLAQALSPASPLELLTAKFVFYPAFGLGLAATLAAIYKPDVLSSLFFWLALVAVGGGFLGIGMTIAAWAKTQRAAFLGGMCYLLSVSMLLMICSINGIPFLSYAAVEFHGPRILHAALSGTVETTHWRHLLAALLLAVLWLCAAGWVFKRRGWQ